MLGACGGSPDPRRAASPEGGREATATGVDPRVAFTDAARALGLDFRHDAGVDGSLFMPEIMGAGAALFDADGDGDLDAYLVNAGPHDARGRGGGPDRLFAQRADGTFEDVTAAAGLRSHGYGMGVAVADVDEDGDRDVFVTNWGPDAFHRNTGDGRFVEATAAAGLLHDGWSTSAAFCDLNGDGWLDLWVVRYLDYEPGFPCRGGAGEPIYCGPSSFEGLADRLFLNRGDGTFVDASVRAGIAGRPGRGLGVACADFDADGDLDVLVANDGEANALWLNDGQARFRDAGVTSGVAFNELGEAEASMGLAVSDVDGDGLLDVFLSHLVNESNTLYRGRGAGRFTDVTASSGLAIPSLTRTGFGAVLEDFDLDGWPDLVVVNGDVGTGVRSNPWAGHGDGLAARHGQPDQLFHNLGHGAFADVSARSGDLEAGAEVGRGLAAGDWDGDGDVDLLVTNGDGGARLLRNDAAPRGGSLRVHPVRARGGRDAHGVVVAAEVGGRRLVRLVHPAGSYLSSSEPVATFGLGAATVAERVTVRWPDGRLEDFGPAASGRTVVAVEGTGRLEVASSHHPAGGRAVVAPPGSGSPNPAVPSLAGASRVPDPPLAGAEPQVARLVREAREAVLEDPDSAAAWGRLGVVFHAHLHQDAAARSYGRAAALDPADARWPYLTAVIAASSDPRGALDLLNRVLEIQPRFIPALVRSGHAHRQLGHAAAASARYAEAIALDPRCAAAHLGLAQLHGAAGRSREALLAARRAAAAAPWHAQPRREVARLLSEAGREDEAREALAVAEALDAEEDLAEDPLLVQVMAENLSSGATFRRAERLRSRGRADLALAELDRFISLVPGHALAHNNRSVLRRAEGDEAGALADLDRSLQLDPHGAAARRNRADLRRSRGDLPGALADLDRLLASDPRDVAGRLLRARVRHDLGDDAGARRDALDAVELAPGDEAAAALLAELEERAAARPAVER